MYMLLLSLFSLIVGITHILNSLLNCRFTMLLTLQSYGKIYLKILYLYYVFTLIEKSLNFQNSLYVIIFSLKYLCSLFISFIYNIYKYTTSGYPFTFINSYTGDPVSIYRYVYHTISSLSIFTFTKKTHCRLQKMCTNNTILPLCNNYVISLTLNYVMILFQYNIICLRLAFNVMVMIIIRHINYVNNLYVCTLSKHGKYFLLYYDNYLFTIITSIKIICNTSTHNVFVYYYFHYLDVPSYITLFVIALYGYFMYACNIIELLCLVKQNAWSVNHDICEFNIECFSYRTYYAVCADLIYDLLLVTFTQLIVHLIHGWYLILIPFNSIDIIICGKNVNCVLKTSYIVSFIAELSYMCDIYVIYLIVQKLINVKFNCFSGAVNITLLNEYTYNWWLFRASWLCTSSQATCTISYYNNSSVILHAIYTCNCSYLLLYCDNSNHYSMYYDLLPLQLFGKHDNILKFHTDHTISNNICITTIKIRAKKDMFRRPVHISVNKSQYYYFDIFSCIFAICFMYIAPIYYRARYLFRLLDYG